MDRQGLRSYTTQWYVVRLNTKSWQGTTRLDGVKSFKVKNDIQDETPKIQSGSMSVDFPEGTEFQNDWYQIWQRVVYPAGNVYSYPLATLYFEADDGDDDYHVTTSTVTGQSVLYPVETSHMTRGDYIKKGDDGAEWCRKSIAKCTPAPVVVDGGTAKFSVDRYYVFDASTSYLKAVWKVLDSAGWVIRITGDGVIHIGPRPKQRALMLQGDYLSVVKPTISYSFDTTDVPNVYYAKYEGKTVVAVNDDPNSPVSTVKRGFVKDVVDTSPMLVDGETLEHYTARMLENESIVYRTRSYEREILDEVVPFDRLYLNIPNVYTGDVRILSQSYNGGDGGGIVLEEEVGEEVRLWRAP